MNIPPLLGLHTGGVAEPSASERKRSPHKKKQQPDEKAPKGAAPAWWDQSLKDHVRQMELQQQEEDNAAQRRKGASNPDEPCAGRKAGSTLAYRITQEQAAEWFRKGKVMGSGMYGAVASYQVPDGEPNGGVWVAVKQLTSLVSAEKEYEAHMKAWNKMTEACRKYMAMPACMEMPEDEDVPDGKIYLVQMLVNKLPFEDPPSSGLVAYPPAPASVVTDTFATVSALWHLVLQKTNQETKFMIAAQYGDMLACLALAKMRHGDLHGNNILVTHNLKAFKYSWGPQMRMRIYFRFHVIDWGFGTPISSESYQTNGIPKAICTWKDLNFAYNPKYQKPSDDWNQEDWRVMFAVLEETGAGGTTCKGESWHGMYLLLKALYHTKDPIRDMAVDGIPRALIVDWVRTAWLARLGIGYPESFRKEMDHAIEQERTLYKADRKHLTPGESPP